MVKFILDKTKNPEIFDQYLGYGIRVNSPSSYTNPKAPLQFVVKTTLKYVIL